MCTKLAKPSKWFPCHSVSSALCSKFLIQHLVATHPNHKVLIKMNASTINGTVSFASEVFCVQ